MIGKRHKHRGGCSNNHVHAESVYGRADITIVPINRNPGMPKEAKILRAEQKYAWEQSLGCICGSGLPILRRIKIAGKWKGFCKKCKPQN